jgi:hypothetical protein
MAQITTIIKGDPETLADQLATLAVSNTIDIVQKTVSNGSFVVVYDNTATALQTCIIIQGDPDTLANQINALISGGDTVDLIIPTFSAATYVVVVS